MLPFCFECGAEIEESWKSCPKCVPENGNIIEKKPLRSCLHSDCILQIQKGHYYCVKHAIKTHDDWCDICKEVTGYHYPNTQQYSYGVSESRNPRWAQRDYIFGTPKCRKCGKERGYVHGGVFVGGIIFLIVAFLFIGIYILDPIIEAIVNFSVLAGYLFIIFCIIVAILLSTWDIKLEEEVTPMNKLEEKILESSKNNNQIIYAEDAPSILRQRILGRKAIDEIISHLKGEYLEDKIKHKIDNIESDE